MLTNNILVLKSVGSIIDTCCSKG